MTEPVASVLSDNDVGTLLDHCRATFRGATRLSIPVSLANQRVSEGRRRSIHRLRSLNHGRVLARASPRRRLGAQFRAQSPITRSLRSMVRRLEALDPSSQIAALYAGLFDLLVTMCCLPHALELRQAVHAPKSCPYPDVLFRLRPGRRISR
jgi:hypothetical protein